MFRLIAAFSALLFVTACGDIDTMVESDQKRRATLAAGQRIVSTNPNPVARFFENQMNPKPQVGSTETPVAQFLATGKASTGNQTASVMRSSSSLIPCTVATGADPSLSGAFCQAIARHETKTGGSRLQGKAISITAANPTGMVIQFTKPGGATETLNISMANAALDNPDFTSQVDRLAEWIVIA